MLPDFPFNCGGFTLSRQDDLTNILFDLLFLFIQYRLLYKNKEKNFSNIDTSFRLSSRTRFLLYIGMTFAPLVVLLLIRQPFMLYTFGWRELGVISPPRFYDQAEQFCYFSASCAILLLFEKGRGSIKAIIQKVLAFAFLYISLSIQGKRAILFFVMICICIMLYYEFVDRLRNKKSWKIFILYLFIVGGTAAFYMFTISVEVHAARELASGIGQNVQKDNNEVITKQRIDFFRDDRMRMAIYSEFNSDKIHILDYPGQTILPDIFGMVPINWLRDRIGIGRKSYQTYFTCGLSGFSSEDKYVLRDSNWMTVTILAEIVSNCSFFLAFFIIPFLLLKTAGLIDKLKYPFNILTVFAFTLLNLFDTAYVIVFIEFAILYYMIIPHQKHIKRRA